MKLLDFYAEWCGPCKMLSPIIDRMKETAPFQIEKINVDENSELSTQYGIRSIPTLVFVNDAGEVLWRKSGIQSEAQILEAYNSLNGEVA